MQSERKCCLTQCGNVQDVTNRPKMYYPFPIDFDMCLQWVQNSGSQEFLEDFTYQGASPFLRRYICSDHFLDIDFNVFGEPFSGIRQDAVPFFTNLKQEPVDVSDYNVPPRIADIAGYNESSIKSEDEGVIECSNSEIITTVATLKPETQVVEVNVPLPYPVVDSAANLKYTDCESETVLSKVVKTEREENETVFGCENYAYCQRDKELNQYRSSEEMDQDKVYYEDLNNPRILVNSPDFEKSMIRKQADAIRKSLSRLHETPEQRAARLEKNRVRAQERRKQESMNDTEKRRQSMALRAAIIRFSETEEQRKERLEKNRIRAAERRKQMSPDEREIWKMTNRVQTKQRRDSESEVKKLIRRYNNALRASIKRSRETPEQRMERRIKDALRAAERRRTESEEERQKRLQRDRERVAVRRMNILLTETPEEREARLKREREKMYRRRHGIEDLDLTDKNSIRNYETFHFLNTNSNDSQSGVTNPTDINSGNVDINNLALNKTYSTSSDNVCEENENSSENVIKIKCEAPDTLLLEQ